MSAKPVDTRPGSNRDLLGYESDDGRWWTVRTRDGDADLSTEWLRIDPEYTFDAEECV